LSLFSHVIALVFGAYGLGLFLLGPCLTAIAGTYRVSLAMAGMQFAAFSFGVLPGVLVGGYLYERFSKKWTVVGGGALISIGVVCYAAAPSVGAQPTFAWALGALVVFGIGGGLLEVAGNAIMADLNPGRSALAVNYVHAVLAVGAVIGPWLAGQLMEAGLSWRLPYVVAGLATAVAMLVLVMLPQPHIQPAHAMKSADLRALLGRGVVWVAFAGVSLYCAAEAGVIGWIPAFMERTLGASKLAAASAISVFWLAMTGGRIVCTVGASLMRPQTFVLLLCALGAGASFAITVSQSQAMCYLFVALSGLAFSGVFAMVLAHAAGELGQYLGAAYSIIISGIAAGALWFPPAMGWIAQATNMRIALLVPPAMLVMQVLLYLPYAVKRGPVAAT
jgi:FHS family glucose/mannose:H+ symporter-like MFS transporter